MYQVAKPVEKEGMNVVHWGYPSLEKKIVEHGADLVLMLQEMAAVNPGKPIHFLTHSMGGLVLRAALNDPECPEEAKIGVAVLLAPPNQGAYWARAMYWIELVKYIGGDQSARELMTEPNFEHLGQFPEIMPVLVIAGNFSFNFLIPGPNDGSVAVSETYLTTSHEHVIIPEGHKGILFSNESARLAKEFFENKISTL